jgi:hypothetical protein
MWETQFCVIQHFVLRLEDGKTAPGRKKALNLRGVLRASLILIHFCRSQVPEPCIFAGILLLLRYSWRKVNIHLWARPTRWRSANFWLNGMSTHCSSYIQLINLCNCVEYRACRKFTAQSWLWFICSLSTSFQIFVGPWNLLQFRNFSSRDGRTPWTGISPSQCRCLRTGQHKHSINSQRYPCPKWESNPWSQCSRDGEGIFHGSHRAATVIGRASQ